MKLLLCTDCQDVIRLQNVTRSCKCGKVSGKYTDDINAEYSGDTAVPIGFNNFQLVEAVYYRPQNGRGTNFDAFVIPRECKTFKQV